MIHFIRMFDIPIIVVLCAVFAAHSSMGYVFAILASVFAMLGAWDCINHHNWLNKYRERFHRTMAVSVRFRNDPSRRGYATYCMMSRALDLEGIHQRIRAHVMHKGQLWRIWNMWILKRTPSAELLR